MHVYVHNFTYYAYKMPTKENDDTNYQRFING